jgi:hypothetical protein
VLPRTEIAVDDIFMSGLYDSMKGGWFMNINTGMCMGRPPVGGGFRFWQVHGSTCVGWTTEHKLVLIHFPTSMQYKSYFTCN